MLFRSWIFTHGIAAIVSTNTTNIAPEEIRQLLTEACAGFRLYHNKNGGSGNEVHQDNALNDIAMRENNELEKKHESR